MDKLFLAGLLKRNASKKEARQDEEPAPVQSPGRGAALSANSASALYSLSVGAAGASALAGIGAVISLPYAGRPPEQLLFDASTADLVLLVSDEINYSRALPVHREVLRSRNAGGYFARLLAEPSAFPEYSDRAAGPGSDAATGPLAGKPMIRRMNWPWSLASALMSFLYRDCCEVAWEQLPELRRMAEEVGARGLCEAVDYLLDPQHLLPWTVTDLRAAAAALRRHQMVEAADRYAGTMRATGLTEESRMATVVYHARQVRPKMISVSAPSSLPFIDGATPPDTPSPTGIAGAVAAAAGALLRSPSTRAVGAAAALSKAPSFSSRNGALVTSFPVPAAAAGGGGGVAGSGGSFTAGGGGVNSSSSSCHRDSRVRLDIIDGVLRSVALDSKVLRGLLLPGRRKDTVVLCAGGGGGPTGQLGPGRSPRHSGLSLGAAAANWRPAPPYSAAYGRGGGAAAAAAVPVKGSTELPHLGSRLRSALGSNGGGLGSPVQGSGGSFTGGTLLGPPASTRSSATGFVAPGQEEPLEDTTTLELVVIVPAAHLAASLASLVQRPLDSHQPGYAGLPMGPSGPGGGGGGGVSGAGGGASQLGGAGGMLGGVGSVSGRDWKLPTADGEWRSSSRTSFDPFGKLSGVPGLSWGGGDKAGGLSGVSGVSAAASAAPCSSLPHQLPPASSIGNFDQLSLALALDLAPSGTSPTGGGGCGGDGDGGGGGGGGPFVAPAVASAAAAASAGYSASRLMSSVLTTLAATDQPQFIVRMDPAQAAQAVTFERRRAASDMSSLNSLAGALGAGGGERGGGSLGVGGSGGSFSTATACSAAASAVRTVLGPANPRDYFIPLADHPTAAIAITLPVGLVLVDPATLEAVAGGAAGPGGISGGGFGSRSNTDCGGGGSNGCGGSGGSGSGGAVCSSARVAALMPHLLASAAALSQVISAVGMVSQVLRVAGEQQGLFGAPTLRASLRISNPSQALFSALVQTNTYFAVSPPDNTIYVRKPPADIVRLLQALHSTLPVKNRGSNGAANNAVGGGGGGGPLSGAASRQRSFRTSLEVTRTSTSSGFGSLTAAAGAPPPPPPLASTPSYRRATFSELNLRASSGSSFVNAVGGVSSGGANAMPYSHGVPYNQLDRLFPGWHLHVVELSPPGVMVEEF